MTGVRRAGRRSGSSRIEWTSSIEASELSDWLRDLPDDAFVRATTDPGDGPGRPGSQSLTASWSDALGGLESP